MLQWQGGYGAILFGGVTMSKNLPQTSATHCKRQAISMDSLEALFQDITRLLDQIIQQLEPWEVKA